MNPKKLREKPIIIELRVGSIGELVWFCNEDLEYTLLEYASGKDCVEYMLTDRLILDPIRGKKGVNETQRNLRNFVESVEDPYSICTFDKKLLICSYTQDGTILQDEREQKFSDYLLSYKDIHRESLWFQRLRLFWPGPSYEKKEAIE